MIFFTKQNIGTFYIIATICNNIYFAIKTKEVKKYIIIIVKTLLISAILLIVALTIMYLRGNLTQFINYAILGLKEFSSLNTAKTVTDLLSEIAFVVFVIIVVEVLIRILDVSEKEKTKIKTLLLYAIPMIGIAYPIMNTFHILLANFLIALLLVYIMYLLSEKYLDNTKIKNIKDIIQYLKLIFIMGLVFIVIGSTYLITQSYKYWQKEKNVYYGAIFTEKQKENIENVCKYISDRKKDGCDVKILSYKAMLYMTPLKINNKEFDLPFYGNLGKNGENGLLDRIKSLKNTDILITKDDEDKKYQESEKIRNYIKNTYEEIGEIEEFVIYHVK